MTAPIWLATAGCPTASVEGLVTAYRVKLIGFLEFGTLSDPPRSFRSLAMDGSLSASWRQYTDGTFVHLFDLGSNEVDGIGWDGAFLTSSTYESAPDIHITLSSGIIPSSSEEDRSYFWREDSVEVGAILKTTFVEPVTHASGTDPATFVSGTDTNIGRLIEPSGGTVGNLTIDNATQAHIAIAATSYDLGATRWTIDDGNLSLELSEEDTESEALVRAIADEEGHSTHVDSPADDFGFAEGLYSLRETRSGPDAVAFGYKTGTYKLNCANLAPNVPYEATVQWERRTAAGNGNIFVSGDTHLYGATWADADTDVIDFTPTASTYQTTARDIPGAVGYQYRVKGVTIRANCA